MAKNKKITVTLPPFTKEMQLIKSNDGADWSHAYYQILKMHQSGKKGKGVKVAVLDTGVDLSHDSFQSAISQGRLKAIDARKGSNKPSDLNGHGTWCVSRYISDGKGGALGFAPDCTVISYKVLNNNGSGSLSNVIRGVEMALDEGVQIISTSLGWGGNDFEEFRKLTKRVVKSGAIWVSASGNDGSNEDIDYPALYNDVYSIGSHNNKGLRSSFSDFGVDLDLYSSGEDVLAAYTQNREARLSGTSMATPSLGAILALLYHDIVNKVGAIRRERLKKLATCH